MRVVYRQQINSVKRQNQVIFFSLVKRLKKINISLAGSHIMQYYKVEYLGCQLDSKLSVQAMAAKVLKKANIKLKMSYKQSKYLIPLFKRLLCNALIQPHFEF